MGMAQGLSARTEEGKQRIEIEPEDESEQNAEQHFQNDGMPQHAAGLFHVLATKLDGAQRSAAHAHKLTEGHQQVDERKRDGHGGQRERSHAVTDEDA